MDFTKLEGFKVFYYLILLIVFVAIILGLLKSAQASFRRTGGKISSIFDEIIIGTIVLVAFIAIAILEPSTVFDFLMKPIKWLFDLLLKGLRFVGIKV